MLDDQQRDEVIVALADALVEISQGYALDITEVDRCASRLDAACDIARPSAPAGWPECVIAARRMKLIALRLAFITHGMQPVASDALSARAETVAQIRIAQHRRRSSS
jgi:hypothetical protein